MFDNADDASIQWTERQNTAVTIAALYAITVSRQYFV